MMALRPESTLPPQVPGLLQAITAMGQGPGARRRTTRQQPAEGPSHRPGPLPPCPPGTSQRAGLAEGLGTKVAEAWGGEGGWHGGPGPQVHVSHPTEKCRGYTWVSSMHTRSAEEMPTLTYACTSRVRAMPHLPGCGQMPRGSLPSARGPAQSHECQSPASGPPAAWERVGGSLGLTLTPTALTPRGPPDLVSTPPVPCLRDSRVSAHRGPESPLRVLSH